MEKEKEKECKKQHGHEKVCARCKASGFARSDELLMPQRTLNKINISEHLLPPEVNQRCSHNKPTGGSNGGKTA